MNFIPQRQSTHSFSNILPHALSRTPTTLALSESVVSRPPTDIQLAALINLDNSGSMAGSGALDELRVAAPIFLEQMRADAGIRSSVLAAWGWFGEEGPLELSGPFTSVLELSPPSFPHVCLTPLGERIVQSVELLVTGRKLIQSQLHLDQRHSWLIEMTDGSPSDDLHREARKAIQETAVEHGIEVHLFGVGKVANMDYLHSIEQPGRPAKLLTTETNFADLFKWLRNSLKLVSRSMPGEILEIPAIDGSLIRTE